MKQEQAHNDETAAAFKAPDTTGVVSQHGQEAAALSNGHSETAFPPSETPLQETVIFSDEKRKKISANLDRARKQAERDFGIWASDPRVIATHATILAQYPTFYNDSGIVPPSDIKVRKSTEQTVSNQTKTIAETPSPLGQIQEKTDIKSTSGPFLVLPEYRTPYPEVVTKALGELYAEYNQAFRPLLEKNKEWETDYQYALTPNGTPINGWVQIDMVGLPQDFLETAHTLPQEVVRDTLRRKIFEIENSLAMYQLLENIFAHNGDQETRFKKGFRASLDALRETHKKPIALLAVTKDKYQAMRESEFGKKQGEELTDEEVKELSGFDTFFGPEQFEKYLAENGGESDYLLYARTSEPVAKLKNPSTIIHTPLLENPHTRRIIKANAITLNIDDPSWDADDPRRINDTKEYLDAMRMAYSVNNVSDLTTPEFMTFLQSQGIDTVTEGEKTRLRAKPMKGAYGCYGHLTGSVDNSKFRDELEEQMEQRGAYVIQPEMTTITIKNVTDGQEYAFIDRNFMSFTNGTPQFLGGFRSLLPVESLEVKQGRIHGNNATVWAEIAEEE